MSRALWASLGFLLAIAACSEQPAHTRRASTERERDSVIGASRLPGARGVRGALGAADSAVSRNARIDSIATQP